MPLLKSISEKPGTTLAVMAVLAVLVIALFAKARKCYKQCKSCEQFRARARMENGVCAAGWDPASIAEAQALQAVGGVTYKAAAEKRLQNAIDLPA